MQMSSLMYPIQESLGHCLMFIFPGKSLWHLFLEQFDDLLVKILLAAAIISFVSVLIRE